MRAPLLKKPEDEAGSFRTIIVLVVFFMTGCILHFNSKWSFGTEEIKVGTPPRWHNMVRTYFAMGGLTMMREHADAYIGRENPLADLANCERETMSCSDVCKHSLLEDKDKLSFGSYCHKRVRADMSNVCWSVKIMRCWNRLGGNIVFDGKREWKLNRHYLGDNDWQRGMARPTQNLPSMRWMHLTSDDTYTDLIFFGWGVVEKIDDISMKMRQFPELLELPLKIPPKRSIIIAGHSEGSGWAFTFNKYLYEKELPNERRMIATGSLAATPKILREMDPYTAENSLFIINALKFTGQKGSEETILLPDVYTLRSPPCEEAECSTFPQFGFSCDQKNGRCLGFTDPIDIDSALKMESNTELLCKLEEVHQFDSYRQCYRECHSHFIKQKEFNFQVNTPSIAVKTNPNLGPRFFSSSMRTMSLPDVRVISTAQEDRKDRPTSTHCFRYAERRPPLPEGQLSPAFSPFSPRPEITKQSSEPSPLSLPDVTTRKSALSPLTLPGPLPEPQTIRVNIGTDPSESSSSIIRSQQSWTSPVEDDAEKVEEKSIRPKYVPPHLRRKQGEASSSTDASSSIVRTEDALPGTSK